MKIPTILTASVLGFAIGSEGGILLKNAGPNIDDGTARDGVLWSPPVETNHDTNIASVGGSESLDLTTSNHVSLTKKEAPHAFTKETKDIIDSTFIDGGGTELDVPSAVASAKLQQPTLGLHRPPRPTESISKENRNILTARSRDRPSPEVDAHSPVVGADKKALGAVDDPQFSEKPPERLVNWPFLLWCRYTEASRSSMRDIGAGVQGGGRRNTPVHPTYGYAFGLERLCGLCECVLGPWANGIAKLVCMGPSLADLAASRAGTGPFGRNQAPASRWVDHEHVCRSLGGCVCIKLNMRDNEGDRLMEIWAAYNVIRSSGDDRWHWPPYGDWGDVPGDAGGPQGGGGGGGGGGEQARGLFDWFDLNLYQEALRQVIPGADVQLLAATNVEKILELKPHDDDRTLRVASAPLMSLPASVGKRDMDATEQPEGGGGEEGKVDEVEDAKERREEDKEVRKQEETQEPEGE